MTTSPVDAVRAPALEMRGITKRYPGVVANDGIDLDVRPGEIHALLGENGAGKTTLMNILYGLARPDEGEILLDGEPVTIAGPSDAIARGINMVHQHFMLVPVLTVAENILLGDETMANPIFLDRKEARRRIRRARPAVRLRDRPRRQGRLALGRLAAAGRDPQGALPRRADPRPRRADRRPDAAGDRGDLRGPAPPGRRGPQHRLHQPQAVRGPRDRGPDHGHPARQGRRPADPDRDRRGGPRRADGRPRGPADRRPRRVAPGRRRPRGRGPARSRDDRGSEAVRGRRPRGPGRRDPRASPASPATARTSWSRRSSGCARPTGGTVTLAGPGRHRPTRPAQMNEARRRLRARPTGIGSGWSCPSRSPTTWS